MTWYRVLLTLIILTALLCGSVLAQDSLNVRRLWQQGQWEDAHGLVVQDTLAFVVSGYGLQILNIANHAAPRAVGSCYLFRTLRCVAVSGTWAYVADDASFLHVIDISYPATPREVNGVDVSAYSIAINGTFAYAAGSNFHVISLGNPWYPIVVGTCVTTSGRAVAVSGNFAYVADYFLGIRAIDISDPAHPAMVGYHQTTTHPLGIAVSGNYAYLAAGQGGLQIFDISHPESLRVVGSYDTPGNANGVAISGNYAYVTDGTSGLRLIDISNPAAPSEVGSYTPSGSANALTLSGNTVFITDSTNGVRIVNVTNPANPAEIGIFREPGYALGMAVNGSHAYLAAGRAGLKIFDVANPGSPTEVGSFPTISNCCQASVAVTDSYAFVPDNSGLRIIAISDPTAPVEVGHDSVSTSVIALRGNYVYATNDTGLRIIDVSNPAAPVNLGFCSVPTGGMTLAVNDSFAYLAATYSGLRIIDITNPNAPREAGFYSIPGQTMAVAIRGHFAFVTNYYNGLIVLDVSNPSAPIEVGSYSYITAYYIAVSDSFAFMTGGEGSLNVFNIANPAAPVRVGYYSTYGGGSGVAVSQGLAYLADWVTFGIYDCSVAVGLSAKPALTLRPFSFSLSSFPNPFNPTTEIRFDLPKAGHVQLRVYNSLGQLVATLLDEQRAPGSYAVSWDGSHAATGLYFCRLQAGNFVQTKKMLLLR